MDRTSLPRGQQHSLNLQAGKPSVSLNFVISPIPADEFLGFYPVSTLEALTPPRPRALTLP
jgi:hypothetical protein